MVTTVSIAAWLAAVTWLSTTAIEGVGGARYCNMENFNVTCAMDEVILIHSAKYGRMNIGRCVTAAYGYVGCSADVLPHLDRKCSGRRRCHFVVPDPAIYELRPCPEDLTSYLEVVYDCVKVEINTRPSCHERKGVRVSRSQGGYLSSSLHYELHGAGSRHCPWVIEVNSGQRVNVTFINFAAGLASLPNQGTSLIGQEDDSGSHVIVPSRPAHYDQQHNVCFEVGGLAEGGPSGTRKPLTMCSQGARESTVYLSATNRLEVHFEHRDMLSNVGFFLVKYEAVGCADIAPPSGMTVQRHDRGAVVRCNNSDVTWQLTCEGSLWSGETGTCDTGILVVVAIGVALGIFLGGVLLGIIILYMRRKVRHEELAKAAEMRDHWSDQYGVGSQAGTYWMMHNSGAEGGGHVVMTSSDDDDVIMPPSSPSASPSPLPAVVYPNVVPIQDTPAHHALLTDSNSNYGSGAWGGVSPSHAPLLCMSDSASLPASRHVTLLTNSQTLRSFRATNGEASNKSRTYDVPASAATLGRVSLHHIRDAVS